MIAIQIFKPKKQKFLFHLSAGSKRRNLYRDDFCHIKFLRKYELVKMLRVANRLSLPGLR